MKEYIWKSKVENLFLFKFSVLIWCQFLSSQFSHMSHWKWLVYGVRQGFISLFFYTYCQLRYHHILNKYHCSSVVAGSVIRFPFIMHVYTVLLSPPVSIPQCNYHGFAKILDICIACIIDICISYTHRYMYIIYV